jgi:aryl-alcohol dehydrogenase-like predicted oxidoreductase
MIPKVRFGRTELQVTRLALGGYPFGGVNQARGWNPFTSDGRATAIATVHAVIDAGINYIDTAPSYGDGNSESIIGEAVQGRRDHVIIASKVGYRGLTAQDVTASVEASLRRLRCDVIDVIQFHGAMYEPEDVNHILHDGLLDALHSLRTRGHVHFIGLTVEEPWTARPLIVCGQFDVIQVRYNLIYQSAALHVLNEAQQADIGVAVMRPMTPGILQRLAGYLAPEWQPAHDLYDVALKFVLSDSRVHITNVGMRWPDEVQRNVVLAESFQPVFDMAHLPRMTAEIYRTDDESSPSPSPSGRGLG